MLDMVDVRRGFGAAFVLVLALLAACSSAGGSAGVATTTTLAAPNTAQTTAAPTSTTQPATLESVVVAAIGDRPGGIDLKRRLDGRTEDIVVGVADADGAKLTGGQPFRVGSISKTFVATMVMQLVDEGRVELDEPIESYLPDAALGGSVTVRQLLGHRSGLPDYTAQPGFVPELAADLDRWFTPDEILAMVADTPAAEPGEFEYCNTNYILLGQLIEALDERPLAESLRVRITEPLGLASTVFPTADDADPVLPVGAWELGLMDGQPDAPYDSIVSSAWASGALISSTDDLLAFLEALFAGELTTADSLAEMIDVQPAEDATGEDYGLGIMTVDLGGLKGYGHNGRIPGFGSLMLYDPETTDALIALTSNTAIDGAPIFERVGRP